MEDRDVRHKMVEDSILYTGYCPVICCYSITISHPDRGKPDKQTPHQNPDGVGEYDG